MRSVVTVGLCAILSTFAQTPKIVASGGTYIGVMMQEVDSERAKALKLREAGGVEITVVEPESPAERGGLKVGDVVLKYNGQRVEGNEQFARMVRETLAGRDVKIEVTRAGSAQMVTVRVAQRKIPKIEWGELGAAPMPMERWDVHMPDMPRSFMSLRSSAIGLDAESLEGQLAQYFGVKEGALVRSVTKGSPADKAGIRAGDVIMKIEDARVSNPADISGHLRSMRGKSAPVLLMRDHKELTVNVTLSDEDFKMTPMLITPPPND